MDRWIAILFRGSDLSTLANEGESVLDITCGPESGIDLANTASGGGWQIIAPYGDFKHERGLQRFDKRDADNIVKDFNSLPNSLIRAFGVPFYIGHPDHEQFSNKSGHQDQKAYGRIKAFESRETGLFGNVKWSRAAKEMIEDGAFHGISPNWRVNNEGTANSPIYRPFSIKSVGFTNSPNMPIPAPTVANSKTNIMNKELLALLGLPETATESDATAKAKELANSVTAAQATILALKKIDEEYTGKKTEFANAQTALTEAQAKITTLEGEKTTLANTITTLTTDNSAIKTTFANERKAHSKLLLDLAEKEGRISKADRTNYETELANEQTFANTVTKLGQAKSALPVRNSTVNRDRNVVAAETSRATQVHEFCNSKMKNGASYNDAFAACKREKPELFAQMTAPGNQQ